MSAAARCPGCNRFSASPWEEVFVTSDGVQYEWGGTCRTHGPWSESS